MDNKLVKVGVKGKKHMGKTNWAKLITDTQVPIIDDENPELVGIKQFKKVRPS